MLVSFMIGSLNVEFSTSWATDIGLSICYHAIIRDIYSELLSKYIA